MIRIKKAQISLPIHQFDQVLNCPLTETLASIKHAGLGGSVGYASDWCLGGCGFDPAGSATFFRGY